MSNNYEILSITLGFNRGVIWIYSTPMGLMVIGDKWATDIKPLWG